VKGNPGSVTGQHLLAAHFPAGASNPLVLLAPPAQAGAAAAAAHATPVVLVLTTALSFTASFGLSSLLWRHGLGYPGVESVIPIYIFIFLVALGVDYNIFLSARIREESRRLGLRRGTLHALGVTGGVITAAGIVLAGTFAALTQIPQVSITEVGTAVALGVLLDTLLVRTVLVPASLLTIGDRVWWPTRGGRHGRAADL
jgi:putative drug exporter of the RND superfamily